MNWITLLNASRSGEQTRNGKPDPARSVFEQDFDRIIFSYPFRRLQDKTQVFPLPETDFVHTRLTHSLEVSSVARSLGRIAGVTLSERHPEIPASGITPHDFGSITGAASLAHDLGNPPFGHSGEESIGDFFLNHEQGKSVIKDLGEKQKTDLLFFEGNAQGFRILNHKNFQGLKLTAATLAAFSKYPRESKIGSVDNKRKSQKKFGFFQAEKEQFTTIAGATGLTPLGNDGLAWCRHPLAFLVEAADDICYSIIDLEDGCNLGLITIETYRDLLLPFIRDKFDQAKFNNLGNKREKVSLLRAMTIDVLIRETAAVFLDNESSILNGDFDRALTSCIPGAEAFDEISRVSVNDIYRSQQVMESEAAGYRVIQGILEMIIPAAIECGDNNRSISKGSKTVLNILPGPLKEALKEAEDNYESILLALDHVSGMTDSSALKFYRLIRGISLPGNR